MKKPLSLKMRAIALLSQREHSRTELRRKLLRIQRSMAAKAGVPQLAEADEEAPTDGANLEADIETLLDGLQAQGYLSDARFVESRVHARASRYGSLRIKQELAQHGLSLSAEAMATLKSQEFERAKAVWQRKFGGVMADDGPGKAKQIRFLMARGYAAETIRKLLHSDED
ncbi:RecX family transcriptional regulator [Roseateles oligotrophus]|uniref:Regulatory protein RecX n=1 Tax=Roseateles oligotrophus TaxID=1769250 RepID=A0ABT2YLB1_9BURK|nr:RecX family transcriptional regulator [Roseateles oligotrophus]MCV2370690.1 RecX family transcriptional regulator [Roseateles oligotrophus]